MNHLAQCNSDWNLSKVDNFDSTAQASPCRWRSASGPLWILLRWNIATLITGDVVESLGTDTVAAGERLAFETPIEPLSRHAVSTAIPLFHVPPYQSIGQPAVYESPLAVPVLKYGNG